MLEDIHKSTKNFLEIQGVYQIQGVKNLVFQSFWFEIPSILIEIQGLIKILGFSFEILGISKIFHKVFL